MKQIQLKSIILSLLALSLFFACKNEKTNSKSQGNNVIAIEAFIAKSKSIENIFRTSGSIIPAEEIEIRPEISGRITSLNFQEGSLVKKNQILVQIDDSELQAELKKFRAQLRLALEDEKRKKELLEIKGISQEEYDASLSALEVLHANVDLTQTKIRKSKIIAPFNGQIGLRYISPGAFVQMGTIIATLSQTDKLKIEFTVPEKYAGYINENLLINFTVAGNKKEYTAQVYAYEPIIDIASRSLKIRAKTSNNDNKLIPGSYAEITLNFERFKNAVMIPTQAIIPTLNSQNVFIYKDGKMKYTKVSTGIQTDKMIQITGGINAGDTIAMTAILALKDNMSATISKIVEE